MSPSRTRLALAILSMILALAVALLVDFGDPILPGSMWHFKIELHAYSDRQCKAQNQLGKPHRIISGQCRSFEEASLPMRIDGSSRSAGRLTLASGDLARSSNTMSLFARTWRSDISPRYLISLPFSPYLALTIKVNDPSHLRNCYGPPSLARSVSLTCIKGKLNHLRKILVH